MCECAKDGFLQWVFFLSVFMGFMGFLIDLIIFMSSGLLFIVIAMLLKAVQGKPVMLLPTVAYPFTCQGGLRSNYKYY